MNNLKMIRISSKLDELFEGKIDLSDAHNEEERINKFYTRAIAALSIAMQCGNDYDSVVQSITDGYHDMGIDAVYNDKNQKKLLLVQSKWRKDGTGGVSQEEMSIFAEGIKRIINMNFDGCNEKLSAKQQEISSAIRDMDYQIEVIFCHTGNQVINEYALRPMAELLSQVNEQDSEELVVFIETKQQDIYEYLANGQENDSITLDDVLLSNWGIVDTPLKAYYGTLPVSAVADWYKQFGNRLFAKNIRYYKGSTEVNQGIKNVLTNEPERFYYYNNGIKILCKKITRKAAYSTDRTIGLFVLEGASLVNGAQTTGVIGTLFSEDAEFNCDAKIMVQMIDLGDSDERQAAQITKLSNTQNKIEGKDFASLDPNQERLRMELNLAGIQYLYKSGAKIEDPTHQISLDETIISQACILDDLSIVALVKRNIGALTEDITKTPYQLLFNGGTNSFTMFNGVQVLRSVETCINRSESGVTGRKRLVLIHGNRFLLHMILLQIKESPEFNTRYFTYEEVNEAVEAVFTETWERIYGLMEENFSDAYPAHIFKNVGRLRALV